MSIAILLLALVPYEGPHDTFCGYAEVNTYWDNAGWSKCVIYRETNGDIVAYRMLHTKKDHELYVPRVRVAGGYLMATWGTSSVKIRRVFVREVYKTRTLFDIEVAEGRQHLPPEWRRGLK